MKTMRSFAMIIISPRKSFRSPAKGLALLVSLLCGITCQSWASDQRHPFTVQDSIEISYIINPVASTVIEIRDSQPLGFPIYSLDGKRFLLISQKGILKTNQLEATIWMFERDSVQKYVSGLSTVRPVPTALATFRATSNTAVISDVRWLDSSRVAFLGKDGGPNQRLFIAQVTSGSVRAQTDETRYVTAYDIRKDVIAYTALEPPPPATPPGGGPLVDVIGKNIYSLLFTQPKSIVDIDEEALQTYPNTLHLLRNGREVPISFSFQGRPLRLYIPTLSLSPDGQRLIAVAPVHDLPKEWQDYQPNSKWDALRLRPDNSYATAEENPWKASEYVLVNLHDGLVSPLLNAPAGRGLIFVAPTKAYWFDDNRRAILTNTFLPFGDSSDRHQAATSPAVVMVETVAHIARPICFLRQAQSNAATWFGVEDISWDSKMNEVTVSYGKRHGAGTSEIPNGQTFRWHSDDSWEKLASTPRAEIYDPLNLSIVQNLNQPPILTGRIANHANETAIWDPNGQLRYVLMGRVTPYHWKDKNGVQRDGILSLPPDYDSRIPYPLVIQPYGYDPERFFSDGAFTTGYGGRAISAHGIVVLQMGTLMTHYRSPDEGSFQMEGFESAINQLSEDGIIDRRHVGILGFSYTCFHVLYAITHRPDLFEAASITDGVNTSYMQYLLATDHGVVQEQFEQTIGARPFGRGLLEWYDAAPGFNFDLTRAPLLISALEKGELLEQWENYSCLRRLKKPVDFVWLQKENAPHILVQPAQRYLSQQMAVDWFSFWLKGEEDSDPLKAKQYERWRNLRRLQMENISSSSPGSY